MKKSVSLKSLCSVFASTLFIFACGQAYGADNKSPVKVNYAYTDPSFAVSSASYTSLPVQLGYFKDEGLEVAILPTQGAGQGVQAVAGNQALMTVSGVTAFYPAMVKEPTLRIIGFYSDIYEISVPKDSEIKSIADLKGKTVGVQSLASASYFHARLAVKKAGLDPDKDIKWLPVGVGSQAAVAYENGDIQAFALWDSVNTIIGHLLKRSLNALPSELNNLPAMGGYLVGEQSLTKDRDTLVKFLRATYKSAVWAKANPEEAVRLHWKQYPLQRPKNANDEEAAMALAKALLLARLPLIEPVKGTDYYGYASSEQIQDAADLLYEGGILKEQFDTKNFVDMSLIKEANDFDREKIVADANSYSSNK
ncbi:MAG: ABC transporter substrate-binding protein [Burkholderiaceae bacterium]|nr:ABC transporter substrate-binding protein [Burkholderiaceae bacterium]